MSVERDHVTIRHVRDAVATVLERVGLGGDQPLLVACSHGPDSLVLADAACALRREGRLGSVTLVYINHGLRPSAEEEARQVVHFGALMGASTRVVRVQVDSQRGGGPEEAFRAARYDALERTAEALGIHWVALGHTASDQAETVLFRLIRGAGPFGLAGIPEVRGRYVRPLLGLERGAILAYVLARGLAPSTDESNRDHAYTRNRLRHEILPILRKENPSVDDALVRVSSAMREMADALDWAMGQAKSMVGIRRGAGQVRLDAVRLSGLPGAVAKRLLGEAAGGLGVSLEAKHLDQVLQLSRRPREGTVRLNLPRMDVVREYDDLVLAVPGISESPEPRSDLEVQGDDGPYLVRTWQPGDRMRPASLGGKSRKLQDLFVDRKVPALSRRHARVVVRLADGEIAWAEHVGPAMSAKVRVTLTKVDPAAINEGCSDARTQGESEHGQIIENT
ncbi:MAG: tRNA lysidine(34) synthetase TilS [Deltaproteobacteria bacterium]|nr:tRNA lysidine(34) synthetase TilS [Deltaproteobacteria bacterium]